MKAVHKVPDLRQALSGLNGTVGFVPTMGALHAGHLSLVERCRRECDVVVVSVFVNPTQFNDRNDLKNYPRTPEKDLALLEGAGVDVAFLPGVEDVYPQEDTRRFDFGPVERVMEGPLRPGHFNGVGQVVSRLFDLVKPHRAYFGEKDFQQVAVIRELVRQLRMPVEIVACPIRRDADGLALSSRNALLNPAQRKAAPHIYRTLCEAAGFANRKSIPELCRWVRERIDENPELETEYFEVVDGRTLQPAADWKGEHGRYGCVAVRVGEIRLIDNIKLC